MLDLLVQKSRAAGEATALGDGRVPEALLRLTEADLSLGIVPEAQTAAAVLGHNFPDSQWYKDSYKVLGKAGVTPAENERSWISRAFRGDDRVGLSLRVTVLQHRHDDGQRHHGAACPMA